jgi:signal transduction histidine kinase/CheY-like chemotaxis protein
MLHDRDRGLMRTAAVLGLSSELLKHSQTTVTECNSSNSRISPGNAEGQEPDDSPQSSQALWVAVPSIKCLEEVLKIPLLIPGGDPVGLVALYDSEPRSPSARQTRLVELYVRQAAEFIDNARLYRQIRDADRRKGEFLAMLGHELRNPLAPILNALHVMRMPNVEQPSIYAARDIAERQVKHLARLVDDLLDLSRIDSGKIELRKGRVDLREAVSRAVETTRPLIESRRHSLSVTLPDDPLPLEGDAARLEQVLSNLLNNAAKYTEPGGKLDLSVERQNGRFLVKVRDNGIGIAPELLPRVFDLFTQADCSLDRSQGGLGIGLTLVRSLVEMHGGRVAAHSEGTGRGSEFLIVLPAATPESAGPSTNSPAPSPPPSAGEPGPGPCRVLLVDDNIDGAKILAEVLRTSGYLVDLAHDGPEALEIARVNHPEVVFLDIGLPGMNGYEVARRLRRQQGFENALLVALTGYGREADRILAVEAGFDRHLVKPVEPEVVQELIAHRQEIKRGVSGAL